LVKGDVNNVQRKNCKLKLPKMTILPQVHLMKFVLFVERKLMWEKIRILTVEQLMLMVQDNYVLYVIIEFTNEDSHQYQNNIL